MCACHMMVHGTYLRRQTDEAQYLDIVQQGHWIWAYDNINIHTQARHEHQGLFNSTNAVASFPFCRPPL